MKKIVFIVMIVFTLSILAGCQKETESPTIDETTKATEKETTTKAEKSKETTKAAETTKKEEKSNNDKIDLSLTDRALVEAAYAVYGEVEQNLYILSKNIDENGAESFSAMYFYEDYSRMEYDAPDGKMIFIENPKDKKSYSYNDTTKMGFIMPFDEEEMTETDEESETELDEEFFESMISAKVIDLEGEKAILISTKDDYDGVVYESHQYMSLKYFYPIKSETYRNGELIGSAVVTEIEELKFDESIFTVPEDVQMQEMTY